MFKQMEKSQRGLPTIEYAIAGGIIAGAVVMTFALIGDRIIVVLQAILAALGG